MGPDRSAHRHTGRLRADVWAGPSALARWPQLVAVPSVLLAVLLQPPDPVMERLAGRNLWRWRLAWVGTCLMALACWIPGTAFIVLSFWYGTFTSNADARIWALLQQPTGNHYLTYAAAAACAVAVALYAARDSSTGPRPLNIRPQLSRRTGRPR